MKSVILIGVYNTLFHSMRHLFTSETMAHHGRARLYHTACSGSLRTISFPGKASDLSQEDLPAIVQCQRRGQQRQIRKEVNYQSRIDRTEIFLLESMVMLVFNTTRNLGTTCKK